MTQNAEHGSGIIGVIFGSLATIFGLVSNGIVSQNLFTTALYALVGAVIGWATHQLLNYLKARIRLWLRK
jgi:hypothetical protein